MSDRTQSTKNIAGAIKFVTGPLRPDYAPNLIFCRPDPGFKQPRADSFRTKSAADSQRI